MLCVCLLVLAPHSDILTTIAVDAPPASVWAVLTDADDFPAWNPMIAGLRGRLEKGAVIENIEGYGADRAIFWPRVLVADQERELRWRGRLWGMPGLFVGEHYFLLRPTAHGTMFTQGEHFSGVLLWLFDPRDLVPAFEAMNVALAARAASHQQGAGGDLAPSAIIR
nr:SRPBCC domain-containing protein [uncultured Lichenicoccus sp.]